MSAQSVNLSGRDVLEHLNVKLEAGWTHEANELDTVCYDHRNHALGYIVTLNMDSDKGYTFTVHEFHEAKQFDRDYKKSNDFLTYDEALSHIRRRLDCFINPMDNL